MGEEPRGSFSQDGDFLHDEAIRKREQALRQHAFFQLRLHIRRGANLVAMDRCGKEERKRTLIIFYWRQDMYIYIRVFFFNKRTTKEIIIIVLRSKHY